MHVWYAEGAEAVGADVVDERAAFEADELRRHPGAPLFRMPESHNRAGQYQNQYVESAWRAWQARAALTASAPNHAQDAGEVVAYWSDFSMVSVRFGGRVRTYVESCAPNHSEQVRDVSAMARVLSDRQADACNVDRHDQWKIYGQDFIADVTAMLAAAPSAGSQEQGE